MRALAKVAYVLTWPLYVVAVAARGLSYLCWLVPSWFHDKALP